MRLLPAAYRDALATPASRWLLVAVSVSLLGDTMSVVTIAWLALRIAPGAHAGLFVGAAVAAYEIPALAGTFGFGRLLHRRSARTLVLADAGLHSILLATIALLHGAGALSPIAYLLLLASSSLLTGWGNAGKYTLLGEVAGPQHRLTVNAALAGVSASAVIAGPVLAGTLLGWIGPGWLLAADAASFAVLGVQAARTRPPAAENEPEVGRIDTSRAGAGLRLIRTQHLVGVLALTWVFYFLYGPVEVALPIHVANDLHAGSGTLGLYWSLYGVGNLIGTFATTALRNRPPWTTCLVIVAGWGSCLLPFGFAVPTAVTMAGLAVGGLVYGPFTPLTYALFQARTPPAQASSVLAARHAVMTTASPLGAALGGPLTAVLGPGRTLAGSGLLTVLFSLLLAGGHLLGRRRSSLAPVHR